MCKDHGCLDASRTIGVEGFAYACRVGIGKEHLEALKGDMQSEKVIDVTPYNNN